MRANSPRMVQYLFKRMGTHLGNENDRLVDANRVSEVEAPHGPVSPSRAQRIREGVCPAYSRSRLQDLQTNERGNALQEWRRPENWAVSRAGLIRNLAGDVVDGESSVTILNGLVHRQAMSARFSRA